MIGSISLWDIGASSQTVASLNDYVASDGIGPWTGLPGLMSKYYICNHDENLWGAITIWESAAALGQPMPPNGALNLIGYPPKIRMPFDVIAQVPGSTRGPLRIPDGGRGQ